MYSTSRATAIETKDVKFIEAGIQTDVTIKEVRFEQSRNGNNFIEFVFDKNGAEAKHTEWEPTINPNDPNSAATLQDKCDKQFKRILDILKCYYKPEELEFTGANFTDFATWVKTMIDAKIDLGVLLRVKFVYNDKGYTTLPKYAAYTSIEPMVLPEGQASAIRILGIDQLTRPIQPDVETATANPFPNAMTTSHGVGAIPTQPMAAMPQPMAAQQPFATAPF